jgi:hypothetical protein
LLDLDANDIARLQRRIGKDAGFELSRVDRDGASLAPETLPAGKRLRYAGVFDAAPRAILTAELEDVRPVGEFDFDAEAVVVNELHSFEGLHLSVHSLQREDGNWIRLSASPGAGVAGVAADTLLADEKPEPPAADAESIAAAQQTGAPDEQTLATIEQLNARFGGWAYQVSDYVHGELSKPLADYLEDDMQQARDAADE